MLGAGGQLQFALASFVISRHNLQPHVDLTHTSTMSREQNGENGAPLEPDFAQVGAVS